MRNEILGIGGGNLRYISILHSMRFESLPSMRARYAGFTAVGYDDFSTSRSFDHYVASDRPSDHPYVRSIR
jgi:hypothetical protein